MKNLLFLIVFLFTAALSLAQVSVSRYYRSNGTYVQPHQRTAPNYTRNDNYSTVGNVNPYTGELGTKPRDENYASPSYSTPVSNSTPVYSTPSTYSTSSYSTPAYSTPSSYSTSSYSTPVYTGPRGGQYYINSNGNKTYISR